jgi:predicted lipoprotein with Yx(FWY)xxD motif
MKGLIISGAALAAAAVALAGCGSGGGGNSNSSSAAPQGGTATVSVKNLGSAGRVLVDRSGRALYVNDQEKRGMLLCKGTCVSIWMPLTVHNAPKAGSLGGNLGVLARPNGAKQVTFNGRPLYTFAEDMRGKVNGDGVHDAFGAEQFSWHVVHANGSTTTPASSQPSNGSFSY